jgi:hypothetical protein
VSTAAPPGKRFSPHPRPVGRMVRPRRRERGEERPILSRRRGRSGLPFIAKRRIP